MCIRDRYLTEDEADPNAENDFGKNVIPNLLKDGRRMYAYHFSGYWKEDVYKRQNILDVAVRLNHSVLHQDAVLNDSALLDLAATEQHAVLDRALDDRCV